MMILNLTLSFPHIKHHLHYILFNVLPRLQFYLGAYDAYIIYMCQGDKNIQKCSITLFIRHHRFPIMHRSVVKWSVGVQFKVDVK